MALALPSLGAMLEAARATARRFPLTILCAAAAIAAAILTNEDLGPLSLQEPLLAAATLGLPLSVAAALMAERRPPLPAPALLFPALALAVCAGLWAAWPHWSEPQRLVRYAQLSAAAHLLVACLPFGRFKGPAAFWQYNRALFVRGLGAGISSGTLFTGLGLALAALDKLFGVDVPGDAYPRLWFVCAFGVTTMVFLGGVPADLDALETQADYPAGLKVFAQYTLLPLVSVYLVILTLYLGKVIVTWDWPSGWIGWLVTGVAVAGILTLLLLHPLAGREDQKWVALFARDFWRAILPPVVMLWLALYQRVLQYGVTEPRYVLGLLSAWLFGVALYYAVTRSTRIRIIPASLCAVAVFSYAGPWSAGAVSERSQAARLRAMLVRAGALEQGRLRAPRQPVAPSQAREISAAVRYLVENHGALRLAPLVGDSMAHRAAQSRGDGSVRMVVAALGFTYQGRWGPDGQNDMVFLTATSRAALPATGYDVLLRLRGLEDTTAGPGELRALVDRERSLVRVTRGTELLIEVPLDSMLRRAAAARGGRPGGNVAATLLAAEAQNERARAAVYLRQVNARRRGEAVEVTWAVGDVLVGLKR